MYMAGMYYAIAWIATKDISGHMVFPNYRRIMAANVGIGAKKSPPFPKGFCV